MDKSIEKSGFFFGGLNTPTLEVVGSNPLLSAKKETPFVYRTKGVSFQRNKSLPGFVKFASQVKYACGV